MLGTENIYHLKIASCIAATHSPTFVADLRLIRDDLLLRAVPPLACGIVAYVSLGSIGCGSVHLSLMSLSSGDGGGLLRRNGVVIVVVVGVVAATVVGVSSVRPQSPFSSQSMVTDSMPLLLKRWLWLWLLSVSVSVSDQRRSERLRLWSPCSRVSSKASPQINESASLLKLFDVAI